MINAVISEFNPFHNGHKYLLETAKNKTGAQYTVCFMSGNFVQRGDIAVCDKHTRAAVAVRYGADLVIQIPTAHTLSSASVFARSGVFMASSLGVETNLCFGSESEDITPLMRLADVDRKQLALRFKAEVATGKSYGAAVTAAYLSLGAKDAQLLTQPNNLLGFEYIKANNELGGKLNIVNIARVGTAHDSALVHNGFASASFIRKNGKSDMRYMPEIVPFTADVELFETMLLFSLYSKTCEELAIFADMTEGLENRFYAASRTAKNINDLFKTVKSKRYTHAKIRRAAVNVMIGTPKHLHNENPPALKVLAFNDKGRKLLKILSDTCTLPVITKPVEAKKINSAHIQLEERASDIFDFCSKTRRGGGIEYRMSPIYIKE